ncbi:MAG TPA: hydroxysqualene dehydroxylase HpnE [Candidatus Kapabacteria bacterium]|nr:hydroxysqualene dehydroxylase HpnE [Candidatus Kapabacteria bacterium]
MNKQLNNDVTIIGAGVAGICAANNLLNNGYSVTLIEQRELPGGRINSILDGRSGDVIDNSQHLLMGAYKEFLELLKDLGTYQYLKFLDEIDLRLYSSNKIFHLRATSTGKFSFMKSILRLDGIPMKDKLNLFYIFALIQFQNTNDFKSYDSYTYLKKFNQSDSFIQLFWEPLILATLNNLPQYAPASLLITVLQKSFLADSYSSKMILPNKGLSELITPIVDKVNKNGIFLAKNKLKEICLKDGLVDYIVTNEYEHIRSKYYIMATQANEVIKYYPLQESKLLNNLKQFEYSPILSVYLWFDTGSFDFDFCGFIGSDTQWLFNRRRFIDATDVKYSNHFTLLVSSADNLISLSNNEILNIVMEDLRLRFPEYKDKEPQHYKIIKEKFATLRITTTTERLRPDNQTEIPNLLLAGDWTDTEYPATIESAAISGNYTARVIATLM